MPDTQVVLAAMVMVPSSCSGAGCVIPTSPPNAPSIPSLPERFSTNVAATMGGFFGSAAVTEYFDGPGQRGRVDYFVGDDNYKTISDYNTNQMFSIHGGNCVTSSITGNPLSDLFSNANKSGIRHYYTTSGFLHFPVNSQHYVGPATVRGITVDQWRSCLNWPDIAMNFTLDYFFTGNWTSQGESKLPVRAEVKGRNVLGLDFHHVYDYYDFQEQVRFDDEIFETVSGVICPGRYNTKKLPTLPRNYYYREEIITNGRYITNADIWYDGDRGLVRLEHATPDPVPPVLTLNPTREIYDFNHGIVYITDIVLGNCSAYPITNESFASKQNMTAHNIDGSYILQLRSPMQFLDLDTQYIYTGQKTRRGFLCDVFTAIRSDFKVPGFDPQKAILEYYFRADGFIGFPGVQYNIPVLLNLSLPGMDLHTVYNFVEFIVGEAAGASLYDISPCFGKQQTLHVQADLKGPYTPDLEAELLFATQRALTNIMGVDRLRVQNVRLANDGSVIHLDATILDRFPAEAQFTLLTAQSSNIPRDNNRTTTVKMCAQNCVDQLGYICNSFDYCLTSMDDRDATCVINRGHVTERRSGLSTCLYFSRTVQTTHFLEPSLSEAYYTLISAVYEGQLRFSLSTTSDSKIGPFTVMNTKVIQGWLPEDVFPKLPEQLSFRVEHSLPNEKRVWETSWWYDGTNKLVRYDAIDPYYQYRPVKAIHDFNTAVSYHIDIQQGNCSMSRLRETGIDSLSKNMGKGAYVVRMANPMELFHLNGGYTYVGVSTRRGALCSVFESSSNLLLPGLDHPTMATFRFYTLRELWSQSPTRATPITSQPVGVDIFSAEAQLYSSYNFYDWNEQQVPMHHFDVQSCFPNKTKDLQISFTSPQRTYQDLLSMRNSFLSGYIKLLVNRTGASPIRFQNIETFGEGNTAHVMMTVVGKPPPELGFIKTISGVVPYGSGHTVWRETGTLQECAELCLIYSSTCNSFDFCSGEVHCYTNTNRTVNQAPSSGDNVCDHYSKTVDSTYFGPNLYEMTINIMNAVYRNEFQMDVDITVNSTNGQQTTQRVTATAVSASDLVIRPGRQSGVSEYFL
ncbi:hypothetical protein ScPMuIL_000607 [Solemya velum]